MKKRFISILTATAVAAGMAFNTVAFADTAKTTTATYMQEKVVYHETFDGGYDSVDFDVDAQNFGVSYADRGDENGKAFVYTVTDSEGKNETEYAAMKFLHEASGDRAKTLYTYMDADVTEISVDVYAAEPRDFSINIATFPNGTWRWSHSLDISHNGYVIYPEYEEVNNTRKVTWENGEKDIQDMSYNFATTTGWLKTYVEDFEFGKWHTMKFVYDRNASAVRTYIDDKLIGSRGQNPGRGNWGVITIEDETALNQGDEIFRVDNLKITQKTLAPITTETYSEDFTNATAYDTAKHWSSWWAEPSVVDTGDTEYGKALSVKVNPNGTKNTATNDELSIRFFANNGEQVFQKDYMDGDISVFEADFKLPAARRRLSFEVIANLNGTWAYHSVLVNSMNNHEEWAAFVGNKAQPAAAGTDAYNWVTTKTYSGMLDDCVTADKITGFPVHDNSGLFEMWHNIRFVKDKTNKTLTAYIDGVSLGTIDFDLDILCFGISSQTENLTPGTEVMLIDNVKVGTVSNLTSPSVSVVDENGNAAAALTDGGAYYARFDGVSNNSTQDKDIQFFIASYDDNGKMTDIQNVLYTVPALSALSADSLNAVKLEAAEGTAAVKAFLWSDFGTIVPLCVNDIVE